MSDTYQAEIRVGPVKHTGSREDCDVWVSNLMGCEVRVMGKDGVGHTIGIVTESLTVNLSARWLFR